MYVGEGSVDDLIDWFRRNSDARLLGLFAAGHSQFDKFLDDVLAKSSTIDVVLGSQIDLILFGSVPQIEIQTPSRKVIIPAKALNSLRQRKPGGFDDEDSSTPIPVIRHVSDVDVSKLAVKKKIKRGTTLATHELTEILKITADDLPALILLSRATTDRLVLRMRGAADAEFVIDFLRTVSTSLQRMENAEESGDLLRRTSVKILETTLARIKAEQDVLEKNARRLERAAAQLGDLLLSCDLPLSQAAIVDSLKKGEPVGWIDKLMELIGGKEKSGARRLLNSAAANRAFQIAEKARIASANAQKRISNFEATIPSHDEMQRYLAMHAQALNEIQGTITKFENRISYRIATERVTAVIGMTDQLLGKVKRLISLLASVKTGGLHLIH
jgi:hypothetical protein